MRRKFAMMLLVSLPVTPAAYGESGTWLGKISDSRCGPSHKNGPSTGGQSLNDTECAELCIASGAKYVFVTENGVYAIANQTFKDVGANIGNRVQIDGELDGTRITVAKVSKARGNEKK